MRLIYFIIGSLSLILGIIGAYLPLLPTVPLLLLSSLMYSKCSPKLDVWLKQNKFYQKYVGCYGNKELSSREHKLIYSRTLILMILLAIILPEKVRVYIFVGMGIYSVMWLIVLPKRYFKKIKSIL